jgi:hypothetical protein
MTRELLVYIGKYCKREEENGEKVKKEESGKIKKRWKVKG